MEAGKTLEHCDVFHEKKPARSRSVLIKWAYGTGSADQDEDDYNAYKMWEAHCYNPVADFILRGEVILINTGVTLRPAGGPHRGRSSWDIHRVLDGNDKLDDVLMGLITALRQSFPPLA
jgi:hypothetical protein